MTKLLAWSWAITYTLYAFAVLPFSILATSGVAVAMAVIAILGVATSWFHVAGRLQSIVPISVASMLLIAAYLVRWLSWGVLLFADQGLTSASEFFNQISFFFQRLLTARFDAGDWIGGLQVWFLEIGMPIGLVVLLIITFTEVSARSASH